MHHCKQLKEVGLDLSFVLDKLFFLDIAKAIEDHSISLTENVIKIFANDDFKPCIPSADTEKCWTKDFRIFQANLAGVELRLSNGLYKFHKLLIDFGTDMSLVISIPLYGKIVSSLKSFFSACLNKQMELFEREWTVVQYSTMLMNAEFVVESLMPKIANQLATIKFDRPIPELEEHRLKLKSLLILIQKCQS